MSTNASRRRFTQSMGAAALAAAFPFEVRAAQTAKTGFAVQTDR